jgi:hypothetical protein
MKKTVSKAKLFGLAMIIIGVIALGVGVNTIRKNTLQRANTIRVSATVEHVDVTYKSTKRSGNHVVSSNIRMSYDYNGKHYITVLDDYTTNMKEGDTRYILIKKNNPAEAMSMSYDVLAVIGPFFLFLLFSVIGILLVIVGSKADKKRKFLLTNGRKVYATVVDCKLNTNVRINGSSPSRYICQFDDPFTGEKRMVVSKDVYNCRMDAVGQQVVVYVDDRGNNGYYVDVDSIM